MRHPQPGPRELVSRRGRIGSLADSPCIPLHLIICILWSTCADSLARHTWLRREHACATFWTVVTTCRRERRMLADLELQAIYDKRQSAYQPCCLSHYSQHLGPPHIAPTSIPTKQQRLPSPSHQYTFAYVYLTKDQLDDNRTFGQAQPPNAFFAPHIDPVVVLPPCRRPNPRSTTVMSTTVLASRQVTEHDRRTSCCTWMRSLACSTASRRRWTCVLPQAAGHKCWATNSSTSQLGMARR